MSLIDSMLRDNQSFTCGGERLEMPVSVGCPSICVNLVNLRPNLLRFFGSFCAKTKIKMCNGHPVALSIIIRAVSPMSPLKEQPDRVESVASATPQTHLRRSVK